jgi:SAM-dependent methyltransferase
MDKREKQVERNHYKFAHYSHLGRWVSYYHQLDELLKKHPKNVLEVGPGDKVFGSFLKNNTEVSYTSVDIAEDLHPDIVGDITKLPLENNSYDAVCVFEVLEHLPYEHFEQAVSELHRVSRKHVFISLPHFGPPFKFLLKVPLLPVIKISFKIPFMKEHAFNGEHYWEIGKKGYPLERILRDLEKQFVVEKHFIPFENQYHHFFVLEKR